ncbi:MAG: HD domain-containing protein [Lachnospiraceae bacterium]|nr:HD domain-containing protein [Lachnospiraceae bacterium]
MLIIYLHHSRVSQNEYVVDDKEADAENGIFLSSEISKSWLEREGGLMGAEYDCRLVNRTKNDIYDWTVTLHVDGQYEIDSDWSGRYDTDGSYILVHPLEYNQTVEKDDEQTFGFILHTRGKVEIDSYEISYYRDSDVRQDPFFWGAIALLGIITILGITDIYYGQRYSILQKAHEENNAILEQSFTTFSKIIDAKDSYTKGHSMRVGIYARLLAEEMGMSKDDQHRIYMIGMMHDIGKIGVTDTILNKPGRLDNFERDVIQTHVDVGGDILKDFSSIPDIADGARYHHERWDGGGYSKHLSGEQIPLIARIICIADSFDAMSSERCYRKSLTMPQIKAELELCAGRQFDPKIVPYMIKLIDEEKVPVAVDI